MKYKPTYIVPNLSFDTYLGRVREFQVCETPFLGVKRGNYRNRVSCAKSRSAYFSLGQSFSELMFSTSQARYAEQLNISQNRFMLRVEF